MSALRLRDAVRAVVVDPDDRVLLVRFEFPHWIGWATPGGGVDSGETDEAAIRRELAEEAAERAYCALDVLPADTSVLRAIVESLVVRTA